MKKIVKTSLLVSALVAGTSPAFSQSTGESPTKPATQATVTGVLVRGTRVTMQQPAGFEQSKDFSGFADAATHSSVLVTEMPAPFALATAGFTTEGLATRGMKLLSKSEAQVGEYPGLLIEVEQNGYGLLFRKWLTAFGDKDLTVVVTASFPATEADSLSAKLKAAVLTARYNKQLKIADPVENLPFTISGSTDLKVAGVIQNTLVMNATGAMPKQGDQSDKRSVFVVGKALGSLPISDRATFTKARLYKTEGIKDVEIISENDVTTGGLAAREIIAKASEKDGRQVTIFLNMIFPTDTYFIMQGIADAAVSESMLPQFRAVANSFKLKAQ